MSGIEIAGLLLGALPVLFSAIDLYKDGIQRGKIFFRTRYYVEKLALALYLQQRTLAEIIRSLLVGSGCEDVLRLDDDPVGYLNEENTQNQLLDYLGPENAAAFTGTLKQSNDIVTRIATIIAGLVPAVKQRPVNLLEIIKSNQEANGPRPELIARMKLVLGASELKSAIRDLDDATNALARFTRVISSSRQAFGDTTSRRATKLAKGLRQVRGFASDLYLAILRGCKVECHSKHETKLFLEDRFDTATDIVKQVRRDTSAPALCFQLIFTAGTHPGQTLWHEAVVQVLKDNINDSSNLYSASQPSKLPRVTLVVPENSTPKLEVTFVDNICAAIETAGCAKRHVTFILSEKQQIGTIPASEKTVIPFHHTDKMSLKALLLHDNKSSHNGPLLPLKYRMLLALKLASNLLQLLRTQWLPTTWSKDTIFFLLQPSGKANSSPQDHFHVDLGRPFISLAFDEDKSIEMSQQNVDPKVALLELGILLLEIWHETTLDAHFSLKETPVEYYERLTLAFKWLDDTNDPLPELYDKAVSYCVAGLNNSETRFRDWEDIGLWSAVCGNIIEPLYKNCKQWH